MADEVRLAAIHRYPVKGFGAHPHRRRTSQRGTAGQGRAWSVIFTTLFRTWLVEQAGT